MKLAFFDVNANTDFTADQKAVDGALPVGVTEANLAAQGFTPLYLTEHGINVDMMLELYNYTKLRTAAGNSASDQLASGVTTKAEYIN